ncbi:DotU family type VI secretion system protein [Ideonella azotifigens]|uniref:DotU family type VI secretion system protein n=1 Tax=Ideonella azotifigens TaxID=513160 RepID=A0ABN1K4H6_9BURK|nr:DotU family type VI secretion system protein [Ideonella azotifigens]MCD2344339.1 DotU family type VI secretion system protein [Ideonella azotifigens]
MDPSALNDPFAGFDDQSTFIKPRPGGAAAALRNTPAAPAQQDTADEAASTAPGLNPLLTLANRLLLLVPQLRATRRVDDPAALRNALAQGIRDFAAQAAAAGIAPERVMATRYVLCTMIDEAAADTPWGGSGVWASHSLLSMFHNETWGGEKVFQLMARLAEKPDVNRDLLELIYAVLTLGFEGRYRVIDNGRAQLEAVRDRLAQILKTQRGDHAPALAQHWQVEATRQRRHLGWLPLAASAAVMALLLVGVYLALSLSLAERSDPVFGQIQSLRLTPPVVAPPPPPAKPRLAQFLQPDIKSGQVVVRDEVDRSVITLRGDGLFPPASATLAPEREALMLRIAAALAQMPGAVLVTGHSDSSPIRTPRFPSNWHLSDERAQAVRQLLVSHQVAPERVRAEGRADAEPLVPNDSPANKAMNRRVEISLMVNARNPEATAPAQAASGAAR